MYEFVTLSLPTSLSEKLATTTSLETSNPSSTLHRASSRIHFVQFDLTFFLSRFSGYGIGSLVAVKAEDILLFDRDAYNAKAEQGAKIADDGVKEAFEN